MKLKDLMYGSDVSIGMLDFVLTAMVKYGWSKEEIIRYVSDILDLKIEEDAQ